ncbi:hypothetical protein JCM30237_03270 [Halolamina litorea]|uniref:PQQ-binding-like beta-propeller repeat protein n=1 Tax=Halolamina litorea TaxID=1515593 RepID=A0ABD6BTS2_9EURY|nr:PQQ-binding-like beta-propeller repeat protein [Halolamina litorea]
MPSTRRDLLAAFGLSVTLSGCLAPTTTDDGLGTVEGEWRMDGRDAGHTRAVSQGPVEPETVWRRTLEDVRGVGSPASAEDRLYVPADAVSEDARSRYRLYALAPGTGSTRWQVPLRAEPNGSPAVEGDRVIVSAKRSLERGRVVCFSRRYGDEEWLYDVDSRLTAPPVVAQGVAYVADWSGTVHAVSVRSGEPRWRRRIEADGAGRTFAGPVAVHDGTLYLGSHSGSTGLVALDARTGEEQWRVSTGAVTVGPVVDDGLVVVQSYGLVEAFDTDGDRRWSFNVPEESAYPIAVGNERVYVSGRQGLQAVTRDGNRAWRVDGVSGTPTVVGDAVFVRGEGRLSAFDAADGSERWAVHQRGSGDAIVLENAVFLSDGARLSGLGQG